MATLADVARKAAVSKATVSRVLNGKMVLPISPDTVARIRQAAAELQYRPNPLARALATGRTQTIGLYYSNPTDPHFSRMLEAVEARAQQMGYAILVTSRLEGILVEGRVDGSILVMLPNQIDLHRFSTARPVVFAHHSDQKYPNAVVWSDREGVYKAVRYLVSLGHRKIAGLFGDYQPHMEPPYSRVVGFRQAVEECGVEAVELYGELSPDQLDNGRILVERMLQERPEITAIFARNDFLALGAMEAARQAGRPIPTQMSVIGFGDTLLARCASPRLTSVHTPSAEACVLALERLIEVIEHGKQGFAGESLPVTITERLSCAPPPLRGA
ncbi:MAG TPA: LacI family DNA-binding transcriptional regulator [Chthonomonadales bacterium]|nr:LacI family DNA-binding transcriptional regulator [Chthonomonadales bacterium]